VNNTSCGVVNAELTSDPKVSNWGKKKMSFTGKRKRRCLSCRA
jgi:hypothetical protein